MIRINYIKETWALGLIAKQRITQRMNVYKLVLATGVAVVAYATFQHYKRRTKKEKEEVCYICNEPMHGFDTVATNPCRCMFHQKCIQKWLKEHRDLCPRCRSAAIVANREKKTVEFERGHVLAWTDAGLSGSYAHVVTRRNANEIFYRTAHVTPCIRYIAGEYENHFDIAWEPVEVCLEVETEYWPDGAVGMDVEYVMIEWTQSYAFQRNHSNSEMFADILP